LQTNTFEYNETLDFNDWILSIGNGTNGVTNDIDEDSYCKIVEIPSDLLITTTNNKMKV
jgi:hypothetical protein